MRPELSIILPVHNQADHIASVIQHYRNSFKNKRWEVILVPNACLDDSVVICRRLAARDKNIRIVENPLGGWGLSVRLGLQVARGRYLCYANSARTDPSVIPPLLDRLKKNPDSLVKVTRHTRGDWLRSFGSILFNLECVLLFHLSSGDVNGTPKIFKAVLLRRVNLLSDGDLLDVEFLSKCHRLGIPLFEIPVGGWTRHGGKSTMSLKSALRLYLSIFRLWWGMK